MERHAQLQQSVEREMKSSIDASANVVASATKDIEERGNFEAKCCDNLKEKLSLLEKTTNHYVDEELQRDRPTGIYA